MFPPTDLGGSPFGRVSRFAESAMNCALLGEESGGARMASGGWELKKMDSDGWLERPADEVPLPLLLCHASGKIGKTKVCGHMGGKFAVSPVGKMLACFFWRRNRLRF
jgi:hypothetical protein